MNFVPEYKPPDKKTDHALCFLFQNRKMLLARRGDEYAVPRVHDIAGIQAQTISRIYMGRLNGEHCFTGIIDPGAGLPHDMSASDLRLVYGLIDQDLFAVAGMALVIADWDGTNRFCGKCGKPLLTKDYERAKVCTACDISYYPRLSPAIIVAVVKGDEILLAHGRHFPEGRYSVIAGYVDTGETLEQCVHREVKEETGIEIKNIRYFGSLPWPCSNSIMIGFTAEYLRGSIAVDGDEITEAGWFTAESLPEVPGKVSLARKLIEWFIERKK